MVTDDDEPCDRHASKSSDAEGPIAHNGRPFFRSCYTQICSRCGDFVSVLVPERKWQLSDFDREERDCDVPLLCLSSKRIPQLDTLL